MGEINIELPGSVQRKPGELSGQNKETSGANTNLETQKIAVPLFSREEINMAQIREAQVALEEATAKIREAKIKSKREQEQIIKEFNDKDFKIKELEDRFDDIKLINPENLANLTEKELQENVDLYNDFEALLKIKGIHQDFANRKPMEDDLYWWDVYEKLRKNAKM